ncbi:hypothetical protein [Acinetobacter rudis]|uniref:Uncharacterized protein n=1 Tax=Acinetobacter rudis CIP 110305 TaxID=421052 RepID=S3MPX1_9GAMM|nr:hypothetical protein [Acinetobacter rudis]EPF69980.1 hypothetical protein F945_03544 [Acinetobacter rudis CIP 110305]
MRKPVSTRRQKKNLVKVVDEAVDSSSTNTVELESNDSSSINGNAVSNQEPSTKASSVQEVLFDVTESKKIFNEEVLIQIQLVKDVVKDQLDKYEKAINKLVMGENILVKNNILTELPERLNKYELLINKLLDQNERLIESIDLISKKMVNDEHYNSLNRIVVALDDSLNKLLYMESSSQIKKENVLLLNQLHVVQQEFENVILKNRNIGSLDNKKDDINTEVYLGAADLIKQQLHYRLGATAIEHSRDLNGLLKLPYALLTETIAVKKRESQESAPQELEFYSDASEAERVKKHLSYKLGVVMVDGTKSLKNFIKMPIEVHRVVKGFQKKQSKA